MTNPFMQLSEALAAAVASAAPRAVAIKDAQGRSGSGILWRSGVVVASEQSQPDQNTFILGMPDGTERPARLCGRDAATNVAALTFDDNVAIADPLPGATPMAGGLALVVSAGPTARLAMISAVGPAWHSMAGGHIDMLSRLDLRFGRGEDGGPVVDAAGNLIGMATAGPRGRGMVIPHATITRVLEPLLARGTARRGWLGAGLQPVAIPNGLGAIAGCDVGLMVISLAEGGPAITGGVLQGDVLLTIDGQAVTRPRSVAAMLAPDRVGQALTLRLLRAGGVVTLQVTITARP